MQRKPGQPVEAFHYPPYLFLFFFNQSHVWSDPVRSIYHSIYLSIYLSPPWNCYYKWPRVLFDSSSVCVQRVIPFEKIVCSHFKMKMLITPMHLHNLMFYIKTSGQKGKKIVLQIINKSHKQHFTCFCILLISWPVIRAKTRKCEISILSFPLWKIKSKQ